jgi:protein-tyrosine phosphatase
MIDLHSHLLFGIDDGARTLEMTQRMLQQAVDVGITALVATPHVNRHTTPESEQLIQATFNEIEAMAVDQVIPLKLHLAAEVHITADHGYMAQAEWPLIGSIQKYMLVELPLRGVPETISQIVFDLGLQGIQTVLAHPERNNHLQNDPRLLLQWHNQGCLIQIDAGSITGQFGGECREFSLRLLQHRLVHCIASDAHNDSSRSFVLLKEAYTILENRLSQEYLQEIFKANPEKILKGIKIENSIIDPDLLDESFFQKLLRFIKYGL